MTTLISHDNTDQVRGPNPFSHVVEASALGLKPGQWPARLDVTPNFGNGLFLFKLAPNYSRDGEFVGMLYRQEAGCIDVFVLND